ncbi:flagellar protein FlaG [Desulfothermus naphthae]
MSSNIKIDKTPPIELKDKEFNSPDTKQVEIKKQNRENIKIESDDLEKAQRTLEQKLLKSQQENRIDQTVSPKDILKEKGKKGLIQKLTGDELEKVKEATNEVLAQLNIQLDFEIDKTLGKVIVKVINKETGKVIRQIPPEEMLKIAKRMEEMSGILIDKWS